MITLKWFGRPCHVVARTQADWPMVRFLSRDFTIPLPPAALAAENPEDDVEQIIFAAPLTEEVYEE